MNNNNPIRPGVLNKNQILELGKRGIIKHLIPKDVGYSSFDLHLSNRGWKLEGSIKAKKGEVYSKVLSNEDLADTFNIKTFRTLEKHKTYVFLLKESIDFITNRKGGERFYGLATGRSSIGRLDVLTRLIVDGHPTYDEVTPDYKGDLYLEITPITFNIKVKAGLPFSQLRIFNGQPELSELKGDELKLYPGMLVDKNNQALSTSDLTLSLKPIKINGDRASAFAAKKDVSKEINLSRKKKINPLDFWEDRIKEGKDEREWRIQIEPEHFYILRSEERFKLPEDITVSAQAVTENLGEIRIHYAGFVHPGFGFFRKDKKGTPVVFEVRGHNVTTFLRHGETLAKIKFYRMSQPYKYTVREIKKAQREGYDKQELKLSNYFADWR